MPALDFDVNGHIATVTLNRPEARNAFNPEVLVRLHEAFHEIEHNDHIRVAIITGSGDKAFCAGADLGQLIPLMTGARQPDNEWDERYLNDVSKKGMYLVSSDPGKPVIAAINGHAIAGGMELVQGTDIRVSVPAASFGVQEVKHAIFPAGGSTVRLPRQLPTAKAMELLLTGDLITAEEALGCGFLNHIVAPGELIAKATEIAEKIAANGPLAVQAIRQSARAVASLPEAEALRLESKYAAPVFASEDAKEGPRAFMEKRKPVYRGM